MRKVGEGEGAAGGGRALKVGKDEAVGALDGLHGRNCSLLHAPQCLRTEGSVRAVGGAARGLLGLRAARAAARWLYSKSDKDVTV